MDNLKATKRDNTSKGSNNKLRDKGFQVIDCTWNKIFKNDSFVYESTIMFKCKNKHEFESWFSDSKEFDRLKRKNLIECIFCQSKKIEKSILTSAILWPYTGAIKLHH